jgi:pimeloyl-ACP methyl ester carboxylesterase
VEVDLLSLKTHTLSDYILAVENAVKQSGEPVVLVGHSFGGHVVSGVAESAPECIRSLVYVSGVLLPSGRTA